MKMNKDYCIKSSSRKGGSILTYTGILFWPMDAKASEVRIEDVAHSLSNMCRFAGHIREFYSVAQHCCIVSNLVEVDKKLSVPSQAFLRLAGLLHDASEAYLVDIPRPIKQFLPEYKMMEHKLQLVIAEAFNIGGGVDGLFFDSPIIKNADNLALAIEAKNLVNDSQRLWTIEARAGKHRREKLIPWAPKKAEREFLKRFKQLNAERNGIGNGS